MTAVACLSAYLAAAFLMLAWAAYLDRHRLREAFWLSLLWPVTLLILALYGLTAFLPRLFGWRGELADSPGGWGVRRPSDGWPGFAARCPWLEIRLWKGVF